LEGTANFLITSLPVFHCQQFKHQSLLLDHTAMTQKREIERPSMHYTLAKQTIL